MISFKKILEEKIGIIFHVNRLLADNSHEISSLITIFIFYFLNLKMSSALYGLNVHGENGNMWLLYTKIRIH